AKLGEQLPQSLELVEADGAACVPGPAIADCRVDADQPDRTDLLRKRIAMFADASACLPGGEVTLEVPRKLGSQGAIIVIARHRQPRQRSADAQRLGRPAQLRVEPEGGRVAG